MIERMTVFVVLILACQGLSMILMHMLKRRLDDMEHRLGGLHRIVLECRAQIASLKLLNEARDKYMMGVKQEGCVLVGTLSGEDHMKNEAARVARDGYPTMPTGGM